ncbi:hypothetical protein BH11PLA1_BH11PLA1_03270 [soil metagenome]
MPAAPAESPAGNSSPAKVCIYCKRDCSTRPRVRSEGGVYACKECLAAQPKAPAAAPAGAPASNPFADDALLSDLPAESAPGPQFAACAGCGHPLMPGAAVCMGCGMNAKTGKARKTKVSKQLVTGGEVAGALTKSNPLMWILGGSIGGAVGVAAWAGLILAAGVESGWVAWGVGAVVGYGVAVCARERANALSGTIALVLAMASICVGKYVAVSVMVDRFTTSSKFVAQRAEAEATGIKIMYAHREVERLRAANKPAVFPGGVSEDDAETAAMFPPGAWEKGEAAFAAEPDENKQAAHQFVGAAVSAHVSERVAEAKADAWKASFGPLDIVFLLLAIFTAFRIGSGGRASSTG